MIKEFIQKITGTSKKIDEISTILTLRKEDIQDIEIKGIKGDPGKDYILTQSDKIEIAQSITVPIVEKIVEKTEIIREQPIIKTEITQKETIIETLPKETSEKIEKLEEDVKSALRVAQSNALPVTTNFFNGLRAKNMTIDGATANLQGDTVHITGISGGGGLVIGSPVVDGTPGRVLYIDGSGNLAENGGLSFDPPLLSISVIQWIGGAGQIDGNTAMTGNLTIAGVSNLYSDSGDFFIEATEQLNLGTNGQLTRFRGNVVYNDTLTGGLDNPSFVDIFALNSGEQLATPAFGSLTFTGNPVADEEITITDGDVNPWTFIADSDFVIDSDYKITATNLCNAINSITGGAIICVDDENGYLTLTDLTTGSQGNVPISNGLTNVSETGMEGAEDVQSPIVDLYVDRDTTGTGDIVSTRGARFGETVQGQALKADNLISAGIQLVVANADGTLDSGGSFQTDQNNPTPYPITNCSDNSTNSFILRFNSYVTVTGTVNLTNTAPGAVQMDIDIPFASDFSSASELVGVVTIDDATKGVSAYIVANPTDDRASIYFTALGTSQTMTVSFQYTYLIL